MVNPNAFVCQKRGKKNYRYRKTNRLLAVYNLRILNKFNKKRKR